MAFNKFMHPKNPYRTKKPNFKELAVKYEEFRQHSTQDTAGKVHLDFKDPKCLRALSWAMLKDDFDLDVEMPLERLIPTIPLRLNYILWLKDIVGIKPGGEVKGIDIGCGASCVYPLLGCKLYKWKMLTTEVDELNLTYARKNVEKNQMGDSVEIREVKEGTGLYELLQNVEGDFDFCMCNPPFFEGNIEARRLTSSRTSTRPEPKSVSTASEQESTVEGGEVAYVQKMIEDSLKLKSRIRVYTTMLGRKKSVGVLVNELVSKKITHFRTFQFCQGRTMRWGLAWTFDPTVTFPESPFSASKQKPMKPLVYIVKPTVIEENVESIGKEVRKVLQDLKIEHTIVMCCKVVWSVAASAWENTWSHERRKRRMLARQEEEKSKMAKVAHLKSGDSNSDQRSEENLSLGEKGTSSGDKSLCENTSKSECDMTDLHCIVGKNSDALPVQQEQCPKVHSEQAELSSSVVSKLESDVSTGVISGPSTSELDASAENGKTTESDSGGTPSLNKEGGSQVGLSRESQDMEEGRIGVSENDSSNDAPSTGEGTVEEMDTGAKVVKKKAQPLPLCKCWISVRREKPGVLLEMKWIRGSSKESMNQLFQYFRNHIK